MNQTCEFSRQPRFMPEMPGGEIEIPNPPGAYDKPEISWFALLAPPAVMLIITFLLALSSQSMYMMISIATTVMTLIGALAGAAAQIKKYKNKKTEREKKYLQFIADTRSELSIAREKQTKAMNELNPEPSVCVERINHTDNRLWERTPSFNDFLSLRLGVGSAAGAVHIKYTKQAIIMESDPLMMEPQRLALEFERVQEVPVAVNLVNSEIFGVAGEMEKALDLVSVMLLQIITHHGYDDVRVVVLAEEENLKKWLWLRQLPHLWDDGFNSRFLLCGKAMAHQVLGELYGVLKARELKAAEGIPLPHYVFIVEDTSILENEPINKYLYNRNVKAGVSTVFIAKSQAYLPMNCRTVVTLQSKTGELIDRETGEKSIFTPDKVNWKMMEQAALKLAPRRIKNSNANFALPGSVTLVEMLKIKTVDEINLSSLWDRNKTFKGMSVPIGAKAGGTPFQLDMHETGHGPHGLVAGTTGSGKSELLQSIIISLAVNYHPHDVVFVLIDYKGGGMADVFKGMPHLVGTITNLGGNQTTRALLSIKSELMRRQRVFSEYGVNNIDKYQKLYYSQKGKYAMPSIPHLIMIADEFAELKQDQPDFMKELVSAARVGRSLGVHLILATQKPAGVVDDQIWSNSKFRICLKVQEETDSKDVIKRSDAARIKEPGRAYIQVGNDEIFELFQSAYSGADYDPEGEMLKSENRAKRIYKVYLNGKTEQVYPLEEEKIAKKELSSQLKSMVDHIIKTAKKNEVDQLEGPWLPPLPEMVYLDCLFEKDSGGSAVRKSERLLSVPVGILDDPRGQRQEPLEMDFVSEGNLFVYGAPGTGKTVFLKTLCLSIANLYSPEEVNIYIMDFGGSTLRSLEKLSHIGGVMTLEQESRINQFILFLFRMMEERKLQLERKGSESFSDYRKSGGRMPAVVVAIDNYFALSETYEDIDGKMVVLSREGNKYGIYLVATATTASLVRYKFAVNFKMAVSFQLTEKSEYDGIVGRTEGLEPARTAGRALVRGKPPLEFQTAIPEFKDCNTEQLIERLNAQAPCSAVPIPIMPPKIDIGEINKMDGQLAIGLGDNDLQPVYVDFSATPVFMVAGDAMTGKSTLLVSWVKMLKDAEIYALDSNGMGLYKLMDMENVTDLSGVEHDFIEKMKLMLDERRQQLLDCRRKNGNANEVIRSWKQIVFVIDRLSEFTGSDRYSLKELLERIVRQERGMKIAVIAADNTQDLAGNWDSLGKAVREEQTGLLLGSIKEQNLFTARLPYGIKEKEFEPGDGYLIVKNRFTGLRCAILDERD